METIVDKFLWTVRSKNQAFGSKEFLDAVAEIRAGDGSTFSAVVVPAYPRVELGTCVSSVDEGYVQVQLDSSRRTVHARVDGFTSEYILEVGDELGVERVDDEWRTIPSVKHVIQHERRIEFWTINRVTGAFRLLAEQAFD